MKTRSVVAHGLLLLGIGVTAAGCAHTDTKVDTATTVTATSSARGTASTPGAGETRYYVKNPDTEDSAESPETLAQAEKLTPESEAEMARAMLFFPVFGVRIPIW